MNREEEIPLTPDASRLTLFHLFVRRMLPAESTEFIPFQSIGIILLVLFRRIIPLLACRASQINDVSHVLSNRKA